MSEKIEKKSPALYKVIGEFPMLHNGKWVTVQILDVNGNIKTDIKHYTKIKKEDK